ncbi:MAG: hypothetical protein SFZ03_12415 [Candidatus Melainabacteria bacterium]|nr:hypothetical protein [Candidatus Melainabacteria bacterium]
MAAVDPPQNAGSPQWHPAEEGATEPWGRWYEQNPTLGRAVALMEKMPLVQQQCIAQEMIEFIRVEQLTSTNFEPRNLGYEKVQGLMKSKQRARWYDQDPVIHRAFNDLYKMHDQGRHVIALKILLCIQAFDQYIRRNRLESPEMLPRPIVNSLAKAVFLKDLDVFVEQGKEFRLQKGAETILPQYVDGEMKLRVE